MSNFGSNNEANDGFVRKVFTGIENFNIIAINPNHEELKKLYGANAKEDTYIGEQEVDGVMLPQLKLVLYVKNDPKEDGEESILTKLTYWITKSTRMSTDKTKTEVINLFGKTAWLTKEELEAKSTVYDIGGKGTYMYEGDGMRPALRGEGDFISMLRNLLNLPNPDKAETKQAAASQLSITDWNTIFSGNYGILDSIIKSSNNKIGLLLGAKTVGDKVYQDIFTRFTLRQYSKASGKFEYLLKQVTAAQEGGGYQNTDFGPIDYKLRVYNPDAVPTSKEALGSGFGGSSDEGSGSLFDGEEATDFFAEAASSN